MAESELTAILNRENGELRARIAQLEEEKRRYADENCRLTAENAALREDKARVDWLDENLGEAEQIVWRSAIHDDTDLRSAIDAARGAK